MHEVTRFERTGHRSSPTGSRVEEKKKLLQSEITPLDVVKVLNYNKA